MRRRLGRPTPWIGLWAMALLASNIAIVTVRAASTADLATSSDYRDFVLAARESEAIGASIYDWNTAQAPAWELLGPAPSGS